MTRRSRDPRGAPGRRVACRLVAERGAHHAAVSLTEAGGALYAYARRAVAEAAAGRQVVLELGAAPRGELRVCAPMSFGIRHVAPAIAPFLATCPAVRVDLVLDDALQDLAARRLVRVLPDWTLPTLDIYAVLPERAYVPLKVRAFVEFLRGRFGDPPYWDRGTPAGSGS